jgi:Domain of unknown function (DUF1906)
MPRIEEDISMTLAGIVSPAPPGLVGFDFDSKINSAQAKQFARRGFRFCIRYISRDDQSRAHNQQQGTPDLSIDEAQGILDSGMALMAVQHVANPGWHPTPALGTTYGGNAAVYAAEAGLPSGVNVWLDLEGIAEGTSHDNIIGYCNNWFAALSNGGYEPGIYIGFDVFLSPDELFFNLTTKHYWRAPGNIPEISHRGYQLIQHIDNPGPNEFDRDVTLNDAFGGAVMWLSPNSGLIA